MKIISGLKRLKNKFKGTVITLGIFDGVHLGHQRILKKVVERKRVRGCDSLVLTFSPHPLSIIPRRPRREKSPPLLTSLSKRLELLSELGIDFCLVVNFTRTFSRIRPETFVSDFLLKKLSLKELVVSTDFTFGYKAGGTAQFLSHLSREYGFRLIRIKPVRKDGGIISSTRIRQLIRDGEMLKAERLLGRPYALTGTVKRGFGRGRLLGFPTANISPHHEVLPPSGVYYGLVVYRGRKLGALANFGFRPTFYGCEQSFEVHIFNFYQNIYHEPLEFIFKGRLRPEQHFPDKESLMRQIEKDKEQALALLCEKI